MSRDHETTTNCSTIYSTHKMEHVLGGGHIPPPRRRTATGRPSNHVEDFTQKIDIKHGEESANDILNTFRHTESRRTVNSHLVKNLVESNLSLLYNMSKAAQHAERTTRRRRFKLHNEDRRTAFLEGDIIKLFNGVIDSTKRMDLSRHQSSHTSTGTREAR
jgi:hypothetical protein